MQTSNKIFKNTEEFNKFYNSCVKIGDTTVAVDKSEWNNDFLKNDKKIIKKICNKIKKEYPKNKIGNFIYFDEQDNIKYIKEKITTLYVIEINKKEKRKFGVIYL